MSVEQPTPQPENTAQEASGAQQVVAGESAEGAQESATPTAQVGGAAGGKDKARSRNWRLLTAAGLTGVLAFMTGIVVGKNYLSEDSSVQGYIIELPTSTQTNTKDTSQSPRGSSPSSREESDPSDEESDPDREGSSPKETASAYTPTFVKRSAIQLTPTGESPAKVLKLGNAWKLQLPTGKQGKVNEIQQPDIASYNDPQLFYSAKDPQKISGVVMRVGVAGYTTSGSKYARTEFREMEQDGKTKAAWTPDDGKVRTLTLDAAITALPEKKPSMVVAQEHNGDNGIVVFQIEEGTKLLVKYVNTDGQKDNKEVLDPNYTLGQRFTVGMTVKADQTTVTYHNNTLDKTVTVSPLKGEATHYFKAGAYSQSNCKTEGQETECDDSANYGELLVYALTSTSTTATQ